MAYSHFTYKKVRQELNIHNENVGLFPAIQALQPSSWLLESMEFASGALALFSEKSRSEAIVFPILAELTKHNHYGISLYSGAVLNGDDTKGLNGECDFILGSGRQDYYIDSPMFCMIEAEDNDIEKNIPQCIAQMEGARLYNQNEGKNLAVIYGCVTTGTEWQFLKLENQICYIDKKRYYINDLPALLGVLQTIVDIQLKSI